MLPTLGSWAGFLAPVVRSVGLGGCPELPAGDLDYGIYMGYPMNIIWDKHRCVAYLANIYNASVSVYDPYVPKVLETFDFPNLTHAGDSTNINAMHASGLVFRPNAERPKYLEVVLDNGDAFYTDGKNVSGPDYLITIDLETKKQVYKTHLNNGLYAGYADATLGVDGNTYVLGTYRGNVLKVTPEQDVSTFYVELPIDGPREYGYTAITHVHNYIIVPTNVGAHLLRFDIRDKHPSPTIIEVTPPHSFQMANMMDFPEKYDNKIMLMTENMTPDHPSGGVSVYRVTDKSLKSLDFLGFLPNHLTTSLATSTKQVHNRIYMVALYTDGNNITVSGHSDNFVLQDRTADIDALVRATAKNSSAKADL